MDRTTGFPIGTWRDIFAARHPDLVPNGNDPEAFRRLTKVSGIQADLVTPHIRIRFTVHSVDVVLCPFDTGFLTLRAEIECADREVSYSHALEFGDRMRHLQDSNKLDLNTRIEHDGNLYDEVEEFVFRILAPHLLSFMDNSPMKDAHFEKLPFFMDERMFVIGFCALAEDADIPSCIVTAPDALTAWTLMDAIE